MNLPCFVLSRKNSKGLKNKNTTNFLGKTLIQHTIDFAKNTKSVTDIIISTDDPKVVKIAKKNGCFVIYPRVTQIRPIANLRKTNSRKNAV